VRLKNKNVLLFIIFCLVSLACVRNAVTSQTELSDEEKIKQTAAVIATQAARPPTRSPGEPAPTPTPDRPHTLPTLRTDPEKYIAQPNDTYGKIANNHGVSLQDLIDENEIIDENLLLVGQEIDIPAPKPAGKAPDFKIIPDSELVYSPTTIGFSSAAFLEGRNGYLSNYSEEVDGTPLAGVEIVNRVARDYSVNPRLLLALLEHMSGWVTNPRPDSNQIAYPLGYDQEGAPKGLYKQLSFAANNLNKGFYLYQVNALAQFILVDGTLITPSATVNPGTAGVQYFFSKVLGREAWEKAITNNGFISQYKFLFGYPFDLSLEPLLPAKLHQPSLQLPFQKNVKWYFTGGPHSSWGDGAAWGALDFAPPGEIEGCESSDDWVLAAADGDIVRADNGAVVQDLDGDGKEQTGWTILYMHIESRDRVERGTYVKAGEPIGHPSCEGGFSTGSHLHIARRYNGTWIAADGNIPFMMDGWTSSGQGMEYNGELTRDGKSIEASEMREENNQINR